MAITDQELLIFASDYDITNWGLETGDLTGKTIYLPNKATGLLVTIEGPTTQQCKEYAEYKLQEKFGGKYTIVDSIHDQETGLDAIVVKTDQNEYAMIFQGSQQTHQLQDWVDTNLALGANEIDDQHIAAVAKFTAMRDIYPITHISGNSLAGGLVQLISLVHTDIIGRTINPAGVNKKMLLYVQDTYHVELADMNERDVINFYTDTDILHKVLGLQQKTAITAMSEYYPALQQIGKQLFYQQAGSFNVYKMATEHTGDDRVTVYGPFDPLTGTFILGETVQQAGVAHSVVTTPPKIKLHPELLVALARKLMISLSEHQQKMEQLFSHLQLLLQQSVTEVATQKRKSSELLDDVLRLNGNLLGNVVLAACNNQWVFQAYVRSCLSLPGIKTLIDTDVLIENADILWLAQRNIRQLFEEHVSNFLRATTISHRAMMGEAQLVGIRTAYNHPFFVNEYVEAALQNGLSVYLKERIREWQLVQPAMTYYTDMLSYIAQIFSDQDEAPQLQLHDISYPIRNTPQPILSLIVDPVSYQQGIDAERHQLLDTHYETYIVSFFQILIDIVRFDILPTLQSTLTNRLSKITEPMSFTEYLQVYYRYTEGDKSYYEAGYQLYQQEENKKIQIIQEEVTHCSQVLKRMETIISQNDVAHAIAEQMKEQFIQLLILDGTMYTIVNTAQEITAHLHGVGLLLAQTNSYLTADHTSTSTNKLYDVGIQLQGMIEVLQEHMSRVRV